MTLSAEILRAAGYEAEATRLEDAVTRARLWGSGASERVIALSVFGSEKYDELASAVGADR